MNRMSPRIQDVARAAGVSTATVSRALSKPEVVSPATLAAVLAAVRDTGYTINQAARNLRRQRTGGVVALVPNLANPFFSRILAGIAGVLAPAGYALLVVDTKGPGVDGHIARSFDRSRADGLIVFDANLPPEDLAASGLLPPALLACEWIEGSKLPTVRVDNREGASLAVGHLADLGHRAIGHVLGPAENVLSLARAAGVRSALAARGLPVRDEWFLPGDFTLDAGAAAARSWLALDERPSAVFCSSDEMACGFIGEVQRRGLMVPRDVSVVGFDNIEIVAHTTPPLTTICQPRWSIGETAARLMLGLIAGERIPGAEVVLPVELIVRGSTAPPPRALVHRKDQRLAQGSAARSRGG
jgi:LacI family transcriptional regulator, repressor for deo operon, udp, cdd, tsx, nupC, and nupG